MPSPHIPREWFVRDMYNTLREQLPNEDEVTLQQLAEELIVFAERKADEIRAKREARDGH